MIPEDVFILPGPGPVLVTATQGKDKTRTDSWWLLCIGKEARKGELLFSSVGRVKLIHGHSLRSSSKIHNILAQ